MVMSMAASCPPGDPRYPARGTAVRHRRAALRRRLRSSPHAADPHRRGPRRRPPAGALMAVLLGLGSALAFGVSDYLPGVLSRRLHFTLVGLISQPSPTAIAWASLPWTGGSRPAVSALVW